MTSPRYILPAFLLLLVFSVIFSLSETTWAASIEQEQPRITTREYKSWSDKERLLFVVGLLDSLAVAGRVTRDDSRLSMLDLCHESKALIVIVAGYEMWLLDQYDEKWDDWERWDDPVSDTFLDYLSETCES